MTKIRITVDSEDIEALNAFRGRDGNHRAEAALVRLLATVGDAIAALPKIGDLITCNPVACIEDEIGAERHRLHLRDLDVGEALKHEYIVYIAQGDWLDVVKRLSAKVVPRGDRYAFKMHTPGGPVWVVGDHGEPVAMQRGTMRFTRAPRVEPDRPSALDSGAAYRDPPETRALRECLADAIEQVAEHNREFKHVTPPHHIERWRTVLGESCDPEPERQSPVSSTHSLDGQLERFIERQEAGSRSRQLGTPARP